MPTYSATSAKPVKMGYKDPDAVLDYAFLWKDWLQSDETITSKTITATTGITVNSSEINVAALTINDIVQKIGSVVTVWLQGGTIDTVYSVSCRIVTSAGRTDERTFSLTVKQR
jgi:hypothetical protein